MLNTNGKIKYLGFFFLTLEGNVFVSTIAYRVQCGLSQDGLRHCKDVSFHPKFIDYFCLTGALDTTDAFSASVKTNI